MNHQHVRVMEDDELLRDSAALEMELAEALVEREPRPEELAPNENARCKYLSKKCLRRRATKAKGELHKLCTFHRAKAIVNQRRLELRKRGRADGELDAVADASPVAVTTTTSAKTAAHRAASVGRRSTSAIQSAPAKKQNTRTRTRVSSTSSSASTCSSSASTCSSSASSSPSATIMLSPIDVDGASDDATPSSSKAVGERKPSPRDVHELEPFRTPATLFPEDLEAVQGLADLDLEDPLGATFAFAPHVFHTHDFVYDFKL